MSVFLVVSVSVRPIVAADPLMLFPLEVMVMMPPTFGSGASFLWIPRVRMCEVMPMIVVLMCGLVLSVVWMAWVSLLVKLCVGQLSIRLIVMWCLLMVTLWMVLVVMRLMLPRGLMRAERRVWMVLRLRVDTEVVCLGRFVTSLVGGWVCVTSVGLA